MNAFGEFGEHENCGVTRFGRIKGLGQDGLNYVGIIIVADENILIALTGSDKIYAC